MAVLPFLDVEYAFHLLKPWAVTTTIDDTSATNLPYRNIGIPNTRAKETPDGILCIDVSNPSDPKVRRLEIGQEHLRRDRPQHPRLRLRRGVPLGRLRDRLLRGRPFFRTGRGRCPE